MALLRRADPEERKLRLRIEGALTGRARRRLQRDHLRSMYTKIAALRAAAAHKGVHMESEEVDQAPGEP